MGDLSRRAGDALRALVAAERIKSAWVPGMRAVWIDGRGRRRLSRVGGCPREPWMELSIANPDTDDPLTVFGLLLLVREAWGDHLVTGLDSRGWFVYAYLANKNLSRAATEAEAVVAALEAALEDPCR